MSTRSNLRPQLVVTNGDMSAASITSNPTILQSLTTGSYSFSWSGAAPIGTVSVEVSDDYSLNPDGTVKNSGNWITVPLLYNGSVVQSVPVTGNTGAGFIDWSSGAYAIRTVYTKTSGTGTLQATFNGKVS